MHRGGAVPARGNEDAYLMQRIGFFSIRGFWLEPLAVFVTVVAGAVALGGWRCLGIGLGVGAAYSSIIALTLSMGAAQKQSLLEVMHEVDSSLQLVDYSFNVWGDSRLKMNSARGEWQVDFPNRKWSTRMTFRGPNGLYRVVYGGPGFGAEIREMMGSVGCVSAGA
jgi:hypothetical protein